MAIENFNEASSCKGKVGASEGQIILEQGIGKPTVLANARKLIEDKIKLALSQKKYSR